MSQYYNVDAIKDSKIVGNEKMYLVKWEGHPSSANSWEPEKNLKRCEKLVREFEKKQTAERRHEANEERDDRAKDREEIRQLILDLEQADAQARAHAHAQAQAQAQAQAPARVQAQAQAQAPARAPPQYVRYIPAQTFYLPAVQTARTFTSPTVQDLAPGQDLRRCLILDRSRTFSLPTVQAQAQAQALPQYVRYNPGQTFYRPAVRAPRTFVYPTVQEKAQLDDLVREVTLDPSRAFALPTIQEAVDPAPADFRVVKRIHGIQMTRAGEKLMVVSGEDGKKVSLNFERGKEKCTALFKNWAMTKIQFSKRETYY